MNKRKIMLLGLVLVMILTLFPAMPAEAAMKMSKKSVSIMTGDTLKLKVSGTKKDIKWSSSKKSVATVSKNGKVKGKKPGTAVITAKAGEKSVKCKVKVTKKNSINAYVKDGVFDYAGYGAAKGTEVKLGKYNGNISQIGFFSGDWFVEVSTNLSPGVAIDGYGYVGIGAGKDTMTYATDLPFGTGISIGNGLSIPDGSLDVIDKIIDYMKAHPDPNVQPQIDGLNITPW